MKGSNTITWLSVCIVVLGAVYAGLGLFSTGGQGVYSFNTLRGETVNISGQGIYRYDTVFTSGSFRGNDVITVFLELPLMLIAIYLYRRGSLKGVFALCGSLAYMLYNSFSLGTSAAYNPLFLVYIATFTCSLFTFGMLWSQMDFAALRSAIQPEMPNRGAAIFLFISGTVTAGLWLSDILPPLAQGNPPALLGPYTTAITYFVDLGIITPLCILAGVWLLRRDGRGYLAGFMLLYLLALMGCIVIGQTAFQISTGIVFSTGQMIAMIGSWIVMGSIALGFIIRILRNLVRK